MNQRDVLSVLAHCRNLLTGAPTRDITMPDGFGNRQSMRDVSVFVYSGISLNKYDEDRVLMVSEKVAPLSVDEHRRD